MEGYAVAELAARADAVAAGLGVPVGELVALAGGLAGPDAAQMSFDEVEQQVMVRGREVLRKILQHVMDARAARERRLAQVTGTDGVPRRRAERGHARTVVTWSGPVAVRRMAFAGFADAVQAARELAQSGLHPANCRLLGHDEALLSGSGDGSRAILVLGFE